MKKILSYSKTLLNQDGIIILDSIDFPSIKEQIILEYQERNRKLGKYGGVMVYQIKYKNMMEIKSKIFK